MAPHFEHDEAKEKTNIRKHHVSFFEAQTTFFDANALSGLDEAHSELGDERYFNLGISAQNRLLFVIHNELDGLVRIISARRASPSQRELYEEE